MSSLQEPNTSSAGKTKKTTKMFYLLEDESKERVLRFLTNFRTLSPLEQAVAAEELGVVFPKEAEKRALEKRPLQGPALAVRARDPSYASRAAAETNTKAADEETKAADEKTKAADEKTKAAALAALVRVSLGSSAPAEVKENEAEAKENEAEGKENETEGKESEAESKENEEAAETNGKSAAEGPGGFYRSRGYQARRLACDDEAPGVKVSYTAVAVMNQTGMPIAADDMREWFDQLDVEGKGELEVASFLEAIGALERNFGVSEQAEAEFRAEAQALAKDGCLTFDKFAYLTSRFARH